MGCAKHFGALFSEFLPLKAFKKDWNEENFQMSATFLEATNIKIYAVLSDFAKCRDSCVKSAPQVPKIKGVGGSANSGNAHI